MLTPGLVERLSALKLHGMARALEDIHNSTPSAELGFEDRLTLMIDHEEAIRSNRSLQRRLQVATSVPGQAIPTISSRSSGSPDLAPMKGDFGADHTACDLAVYASPLRLPPRRKTRFRLAATLGRSGLQPAGSVRKVSETPLVISDSRHLVPLPQAWPGARLAPFFARNCRTWVVRGGPSPTGGDTRRENR